MATSSTGIPAGQRPGATSTESGSRSGPPTTSREEGGAPSSNGQRGPTKHPATLIVGAAMPLFTSLGSRFGMNPAARAQMMSGQKAEHDAGQDLLSDG